MATTKKRAKSATTDSTTTAAAAPKAAKKAAKKSTTKKAVKKTAKRATKKKTAKKATTKKTTKKSSTKKSAPAAQEKAAKAAASAMKDIIARARDHFRKAPKEHTFFVADGRTIQDLRELAEALEEMADHVFAHHVNEHRHDFANWVHEVLQERALAEQLREAQRHPESHQRVIYRHIVRRAW